jgi:hypothetical protein
VHPLHSKRLTAITSHHAAQIKSFSTASTLRIKRRASASRLRGRVSGANGFDAVVSHECGLLAKERNRGYTIVWKCVLSLNVRYFDILT